MRVAASHRDMRGGYWRPLEHRARLVTDFGMSHLSYIPLVVAGPVASKAPPEHGPEGSIHVTRWHKLCHVSTEARFCP